MKTKTILTKTSHLRYMLFFVLKMKGRCYKNWEYWIKHITDLISWMANYNKSHSYSCLKVLCNLQNVFLLKHHFTSLIRMIDLNSSHLTRFNGQWAVNNILWININDDYFESFLSFYLFNLYLIIFFIKNKPLLLSSHSTHWWNSKIW